MRIRESGEFATRWYWMPLTVLALGVGSIILLAGSSWIRERLMTEDVLRVRSVGEIQTAVAISHLWIEEHVSGDEVDLAEVAAGLQTATANLERITSGGALGANRFLFGTAAEADPPAVAASARQRLALFAQLTTQRRTGFEAGRDVGIGSAVDVEYDRVFAELLADLRSLEAHFKRRLARAQERSRLLLRAILVVWVAIVALAVGGLWTRERRRQATAEELVRSREQLLQAQKMEAVGRLAGGIAHDINNYLAAITAQCELELMKAEPGGRTARRMEAVLSTVGSASTLIKRLLAFSRRQPAHPEPTDVGAVVAGLEKMMTRLLGEDVRLRTRVSSDAGSVLIDVAQLEQILLNLVVNAREAMPTGGRLEIEVAGEGEEVRLVVRDEGCGIAPELRPRIFEPFFTTKDKSTNSGLGLATVLGIVEQNGGRIDLESEPEGGTTFTVVFPRSAVPAAAPASRSREPQPTGAGTERILLVEDNAEVRASARDLLRELGYLVEVAEDGRHALELFDRHGGFDLVITDVVMPGIGGREFADLLGERDPGVRVIFTSGHTDSIVLKHGIERGDVDFLAKPVAAATLAAKIREVLARPATSRPGDAPRI